MLPVGVGEAEQGIEVEYRCEAAAECLAPSVWTTE